MSSSTLWIAILLALAYNIILNLSKGIQKYGIEGLSVETLKKWRERPELKKKFYFWAIGSIGTSIAVVFQFLAQPYAPNASFVAAFGGIGLMALVIFSYFVLKENIRIPEWIGIIIVVIATSIFGFIADESMATTVDYIALLLMCLIILGLFFLFAIWSYKHEFKGHALIWGSIGGFFSGLGIALSQTAAIGGDRELLAMLLTFDLWVAILTGNGAFWGTQYGFKHGSATMTVTMYNTFMLVTPILIDIFVLNQSLPPIQLIILAVIGVGVVLLTAFRRENVAPPPSELPNPIVPNNPSSQ
jgi:uncharacterized membrane protein